MALRVFRCMLAVLAGQYAAALDCARRRAIAQVTAAVGCATTTAARAADVPLVGRFARNEGAKEFVGDWRLETTTGAKGRLVFEGLAIANYLMARSCSARAPSLGNMQGDKALFQCPSL